MGEGLKVRGCDRKDFTFDFFFLYSSGMPVVVGSQCPGGPVKLNAYSTGVQLQKMVD